MGTTPQLKLPYPELTDTADGPGAVSGLAQSVENYVYNRSLPSGVTRTLIHHWGTRSTFPTTGDGVRVGDQMYHSGFNCNFVYNGSIVGSDNGWRQVDICLKDTAARNGLPMTKIHDGFLVQEPTGNRLYRWDGVSTFHLIWDPTDLDVPGTLTVDKLRVLGTGDVSVSSTNHGFQIGLDNSNNTLFDNNEMASRVWNNTTKTWEITNWGITALNVSFSGTATLGAQGTSTASAVRKDYVDGKFADTGWDTFNFASGWTKQYAYIRKYAGITYFSISAGRSTWNAGQVLMTLSASYRPSVDQTVIGQWGGQSYEIHVNSSNGVCTLAGVGGANGILATGSWPMG